jgi:hypothetical protein
MVAGWMLGRCHRLAVARCGALLVALALSGALPHVAALADEREHRCACRHGADERCTCAGCRRATARARSAALAALPPCHRAAASAAMAREERAPCPGEATVTGCCGAPEQHRALAAGEGPFLAPAPAALAAPAPGRHPPHTAPGEPPGLVRAPPTPPPRRA